jgi:hypothetical protein
LKADRGAWRDASEGPVHHWRAYIVFKEAILFPWPLPAVRMATARHEIPEGNPKDSPNMLLQHAVNQGPAEL